MIGELGNHCLGLGSKCGHSLSGEDKCLIDGRSTTSRPCPAGKFDMYVWEGINQDWRKFRGYIQGTMKEIN